MIKSIIAEGPDRLGKSSLIQGLKDQLGYFDVIHYQKPKLLQCYEHPDRNKALRRYQEQSFENMFKLLASGARLILDRAHLGESVYGNRYRNYDGNYVFILEHAVIASQYPAITFADTTLLVLLTTSSFDFIQDDGLSFDFSKKEEEQQDFIKAFERSAIRHKLMIDVHDGHGGFRPKEEILNAVIHAYM
jgi:thymidylate kinase